MLWEAANRAAGQAPVLDDYVANRATAGATYLALMLNEGLAKYELPDILHQCGPLSALRTLAGDHICWVNDLLSLEREEQRGDVHNLVLVLERTFGYGRARAVAEAVRMANERMTAIGLLADQIPAYQSAAGLPPATADYWTERLMTCCTGWREAWTSTGSPPGTSITEQVTATLSGLAIPTRAAMPALDKQRRAHGACGYQSGMTAMPGKMILGRPGRCGSRPGD